MNLILWILAGGLIGSATASLFAHSLGTVIGDVLSAILGSLAFGFMTVRFAPETEPTDLDQQSFNPIILFVALIGAIISISLYNWYF